VFIENRIIRATRYAIRIMPPIAILRCAGKSRWAASWARRGDRAVCAEPADAGIMVVG
jgi:uncharacterized membrane protein YfbV (UPF0208 family)